MPRCILVLALFCLTFPVVWAQPPQAMISYEQLDNEAVVKMVHDGVPDEAIIQEIKTHTGHFDLSPESVNLLKKTGVSDQVIAAMREAANPKPTPPPTPPSKPAAAPPAPMPHPAPRVYRAESPPAPAPSAPTPPTASPPPSTTAEAAKPSPAAPATVPTTREVVPPAPPASPPAPNPAAETGPEPAPERQPKYSHSEFQQTPRVELFGGFALTRSAAVQGNLNGWNAGLAGNINRWLGFVGDISKQSENQSFVLFDLNRNVYLLLFGPQVSFRSGRFHGFGRGLVGTSYSSLQTRTLSTWSPAYGFGGGVDLAVTSGFALRVLQFDTIVRNEGISNRTEHRLSFGGVVRF